MGRRSFTPRSGRAGPPSSSPPASTAPSRAPSASRGRRFSRSPPPARWRFCSRGRSAPFFGAALGSFRAGNGPALGDAGRGADRRWRTAGAARKSVFGGLEPGRQVTRRRPRRRRQDPARVSRGRVLHEDNQPLYPRPSVSPSGDQVAFLYKRSSLCVSEPGGGIRDLGERAQEIAWCRPTNEIWFDSVAGGTSELFAVAPGRTRGA